MVDQVPEPTLSSHDLEEQTKIALQYVNACRQEIIERLKMRDQIMLAYIGAVAALSGYAAKTPGDKEFDYHAMLASGVFQLLPVLLPLLSFVASFSLAVHSEQIHAFAQYMAEDLRDFLPSGVRGVPLWELSGARSQSQAGLIKTILYAQIVLMGVPWLLLLGIYCPYVGDPQMGLKNGALAAGTPLIVASIWRLYKAWRFRKNCDDRIKAISSLVNASLQK